VQERELRWHALTEGKYQLLQPGPDGVFRSRVFPGLWLDAPAFFKGDIERVLATLQRGLQSPEHQQFVEALAVRKQ
jgi:hypothetical protein